MKPRFLLVSILLGCVTLAAASNETRPVEIPQIAAWLAAGVTPARLVQLVQERGLASAPTSEELRQLEAAGADPGLVRLLRTTRTSSGNVLELIPASLAKAAVAARNQNFHEAELLLREALTSSPTSAALHFALGTMLRQQEQWDDAFEEFTQAARLMPDLPEIHTGFAYIFYRLGDAPNAISEARTSLSMDPKNAEAYQLLGLGLYADGQYVPAAHAFQEALSRDPQNPDTLYDLGIVLHAAGDDTGAMSAYHRALHLRPDFWEAHSNLGLILHKEGKLAEAAEEYRAAKRIAPDEASVRNNLGNTYCDQNNYDAAIAEMKELYQQHPEWQQGHACLASAYLATKQYAPAIEQLELAVRQNPTGSSEHRVLGQALLLDNRAEEALHEFRLAVTLNPDSDVAHHFLGTVLFQQQQPQAAEKEFREAVRLNPTADNHFSLAACLTSLDRYEEALSELEQAARLDPGHELYRARREELMKLMKSTSAR